MTFGKFLVLVQLGAGVVSGLIGFALAIGDGGETAIAVFTALSTITIITGLITATTLPQFARMMEDSDDD